MNRPVRQKGAVGQGGRHRHSGNFGRTELSVDIKNISKDLFSRQADECAQAVAESGKRNRSSVNKPTQLRRFYDELEMRYSQVFSLQSPEQRAQKLDEILPFIQMLIAKAAYAQGRGHIDATFNDLFSSLITQIDTVDDLRNAKLFMEAFMGFYRQHGRD